MKAMTSAFSYSGGSPPTATNATAFNTVSPAILLFKLIPLTQGYFAQVDAADYDAVSQFKWHASVKYHPDGSIKNVYAARNTKTLYLYLHRFILGVTNPDIEVDDADHNGLNCQRYNIRLATFTQNQQNKQKADNVSGFKGVRWNVGRSRWESAITVAGKSKHLGLFKTAEAAALAYDAAALKFFGEFAATNLSLGLLAPNPDREKLNTQKITTPKAPTHSQSTSISGFKGVYWNTQRNNWRAEISVGKRTRYLGSFTSPVNAALAYDIAAIAFYGKFARTNASLGLLKKPPQSIETVTIAVA